MSTVILFWYLLCNGSDCNVVPFEVTREAAAIITMTVGMVLERKRWEP